jgi:lipopolysaccharide export system permease protein
MPRLDRYLLRDVAWHFIAVTGVLVVVYSSFLFAKVLLLASNNEFAPRVVLGLLGLATLQNLVELIPVGVFLGTLLALGRLYHDSEVAAMQACGYGMRQWCRPVLAVAGSLMVLLLWLAVWVAPQSAARAQEIRLQALREARFASLEPQRFRNLAGGDVVFYAEQVDSAGVLYNVFVQRQVGDKLEIIVAERAEQRGAGEARQSFILYRGRRYEGVAGSAEFRIAEFAEHGIPVLLPTAQGGQLSMAARSTATLWRSALPDEKAELQSRFAAPLMTLILALLAIPLSRLRPRQGRYANLGLGLLVFFLYLQSAKTAGILVAKQTVPAVIGVWWVHVLALALAIWLLLRQDPPLRWLRMEAQ